MSPEHVRFKTDSRAPPYPSLAGLDWTFSLSRYTALTPTLLVLTPLIKSLTTLHLLHLPSKKLVPLSYSTQTSTPFVTVDGLRRISDTSFLFVGTTDSSPPALSILDVASGEVTAVKKSSEVDEKEVSKGMFSSAQGLEFDVPTGEGGKMVNLNVLHFAPKNENYSGGVDGELPPAIIRCHGGPVSSSIIFLFLVATNRDLTSLPFLELFAFPLSSTTDESISSRNVLDNSLLDFSWSELTPSFFPSRTRPFFVRSLD